jgi:type II secretory pathway pseudopilin PulG
MLSVFVGVVGLILFITLALAGALVFGQSSYDTKALAAIQAVSQVSSAASLYRLNGGRPHKGMEASELVQSGYLKAAPSFHDGGAVVLGHDGETSVSMVLLEDAEDICGSINRQTNHEPDIPSVMIGPLGCYVDGDGRFYAYANL